MKKPEILETVEDLRNFVDAQRGEGKSIGLVPTMGALHAGHLRLVENCAHHADVVIVSIFVNPTQFAPDEDYEEYPRDIEADAAALQEMAVSVIFAPSVEEMYPSGSEEQAFRIEVSELTDTMCGRHRPGHFTGVATVVTKLFNSCQPDVACFGLKDAQQFVVIKRLVKDLHLNVEIVGVPTVREEDGLALSSRNVYLTADERSQAVVLSQAIAVGKRMITGGERNPSDIIRAMTTLIEGAPLARPQYVEILDAKSLQPISTIEGDHEVLAAVAVFFGDTRLIDNAFVVAPAGS